MIRSPSSFAISRRGWVSLVRRCGLPGQPVRMTRAYRLYSHTSTIQATETKTTSPLVNKMSVIGAGTMASAMVEPLVASGMQPANQMSVFDVSETAMERMHESYGIPISQSIPDCMEDSNLVLLAVKPQNLTSSFFEQMKQARPKSDAIVLSVIAGTPISVLEEGGIGKVVRSMPNTPATIGSGMTVWSCTSNLSTEDRHMAGELLGSFGETVSTRSDREQRQPT